jgi:hypothetical protein
MLKYLRIALLSMGALFAFTAMAQPGPGPDDDAQSSADQPDPPSRVGRLSYVRGAVSFVPAGENDWVEAQVNRPLITGDKLWTDHDSRAELEIGSSAIRIDEQTSFDFLNLDDQTAQVELTQGSLNLRVRRLYDNQVYEIDTPTLAFVINRVGEYRVTVAPTARRRSSRCARWRRRVRRKRRALPYRGRPVGDFQGLGAARLLHRFAAAAGCVRRVHCPARPALGRRALAPVCIRGRDRLSGPR